MNETPIKPAPQKGDHAVAITAIIAVAFVTIVCILGFSVPLVIAAINLH